VVDRAAALVRQSPAYLGACCPTVPRPHHHRLLVGALACMARQASTPSPTQHPPHPAASSHVQFPTASAVSFCACSHPYSVSPLATAISIGHSADTWMSAPFQRGALANQPWPLRPTYFGLPPPHAGLPPPHIGLLPPHAGLPPPHIGHTVPYPCRVL
jgi:hypothetical protein